MKTIIVTAADAFAFPLLKELVLSLHFVHFQTLADLGVIDLGLKPLERAWLENHAVQIIEGGEKAFARQISGQPPFHPAQLAKLYLPEYFPQYEIFIWLDADIWIQNLAGLQLYLAGCENHQRLVITPQIHRCYSSMYQVPIWDKPEYWMLAKTFDPEIAKEIAVLPVINSGAFALPAPSPVWQLWQKTTHQILDSYPHFFAEQMALNFLIYTQQIASPIFLPSWCNYICHLALPLLNLESQMFFEPPLIPSQEISLLHLAGARKTGLFNLFTTTGQAIQSDLLFSTRQPNFAKKTC